MKLDQETMYRAFAARDASCEGLFFAAVRSTGIFCRPSCPAKKPRPENVEFFPTLREALISGYRPCKICKPLEKTGEPPPPVAALLKEISANPGLRLKDQDLRERRLDPVWLRRWFQKHHGLTFHAFLRSLRLAEAFVKLKAGSGVLETAFESGYESLSGFTEGFKKSLGFTPGRSAGRRLLKLTRLPTPLGPMLAVAVDEGLCLLEFADRRMLETQFQRLSRQLEAALIPGTSPWFDQLAAELEEYFSGRRREFTVPLRITGTPFQRRAWEKLREIPYGGTTSYREQAARLGRAESVRAVARANGDNKIAIIIPCHRVIGSRGELTGYGGGLWRKQFLLDLEKKHR